MRVLIRDLGERGITVLLSSHQMIEVEELCNRVAIIRSGRIAYEGSLARASQARRGSATGCGPPTTRGRAEVCAASRASRWSRRPRPAARFQGRRRGRRRRRSRVALAESGAPVVELTPQQATLEDLFFRLTEGEARRVTPASRAADRGGGMRPGVLTVYRWELRKLRAQKRTYLGLGAAAAVPIIFVIALATARRRPERRRLRPLRPRHRPRDPARAPAVRFDLDVPADHRAGRRGHRRLRGPQRHAEDDPHPLGRAPAGVRRQGRWRRRPTRSSRSRSPGAVALVAGILASGLQPDRQPLRERCLGAARASRWWARACSSTCCPILAIACIGAAALDGLPQQRRGDRRHADVLAAAAARRHPARASAACTRTCSARSSTPGRGSCGPRSDWAPIVRAVWVCALYAAPGARRRGARLPAPRRRRELGGRLRGEARFHPTFHSSRDKSRRTDMRGAHRRGRGQDGRSAPQGLKQEGIAATARQRGRTPSGWRARLSTTRSA